MDVSLPRFKVIAIAFRRMFVPLLKLKIVVTGLVVLAVFGVLLHRQHAVFGQTDRSEEIAINNHVWDVWRTTVVGAANKELSRIRQISASTSYQSLQTAQALMEAYDATYEMEVATDPKFGGIDCMEEADQKYPRFEFLKMLLDKGVIIESAAEYRALLTFRINLLSAENMFLQASAEEKILWLSGLGLPTNSSWEAFKAAQIQDYLECFYYEKEANQYPTLARQMAEGIFMLGRAKDGTLIPMRTDTTYFQVDSVGGFDFGDMVWPAMGLDVEAIHKHLRPYPFTEKLPKHVKIGFLGRDGKPADAPRRGLAKLWGNFPDMFDDGGPEITRSESDAAASSEAELQPPAYASEPKPVSRTSPWSSVADSPAHDSTPRTAPRHAVPELEMSEFPADWERPDSASIIPSEIENQMTQVEDWKLPDGVKAEKLERLLESLEDIDDPTSNPNVPEEPEMVREDRRNKGRGDANGNRDESL